MSVLQDCDVYFYDGNVLEGTSVLFRDNGWVRVGEVGSYTYHPPGSVERVEHAPAEDGDE